MKIFIYRIIVIIFFIGFLLNCSDDPEVSKVELIAGSSSKEWSITSFKVRGEESIEDVFEPCDLDDIYTFYRNFDYKLTEGEDVCASSESEIVEQGKWELGVNGKSLDVGDLTGTIQTIDQTKMVVNVIDPTLGPVIVTFTAK